MKASAVANRTKSFKYVCDDGTMLVTYNENAVTSKALDEVAKAGEGDDTFTRMDLAAIEFLCKVIISWELEEDDGSMVPITPERLKSLPTLFLVDLNEKIQGDLAPGEASAVFAAG